MFFHELKDYRGPDLFGVTFIKQDTCPLWLKGLNRKAVRI